MTDIVTSGMLAVAMAGRDDLSEKLLSHTAQGERRAGATHDKRTPDLVGSVCMASFRQESWRNEMMPYTLRLE
jgi:hypothetical protein